MTEKDFVTFDIAKDLKDLHFDERCFAYFNPNGVFFWKSICADEDKDYTLSIKEILEYYIHYDPAEAPLLDHARKWLRDKHEIDIEILVDQTSYPKYTFNVIKFRGIMDFYNVPVDKWFLYREYEEALIEAIKVAIKFIKNGNN